MKIDKLAKKPDVFVPNDIHYATRSLRSGDEIPGTQGIMYHSGALIGVSKTRAVWRFGFLKGSNAAAAYGCEVNAFLWILADRRGRVLNSFTGPAIELPSRFRNVIDSVSF